MHAHKDFNNHQEKIKQQLQEQDKIQKKMMAIYSYNNTKYKCIRKEKRREYL